MVFGTRHQAEELYGEIETVLATVGLRLATDKTRVVGIDEGFDFLGFRIQRHRQRGSDRKLIYTYPSKKSLNTIRRKVTTATGRQTTSLPAKNASIGMRSSVTLDRSKPRSTRPRPGRHSTI